LGKPISTVMKPKILFLFLIIVGLFSNAQKIIENPKIGISNQPMVKISKVEILNNATILTFEINFSAGSRIGIAKKSFIQEEGNPDSLFMTRSEAPKPDSTGWIIVPEGGLTYRLFFPKISPKTTKINFGEPKAGSWDIFDIQIGETKNNSLIPLWLKNNWFSSESGKWVISFLDSNAVFDSQIWKYKDVELTDSIYSITFKNDTEEKTIRCMNYGVNLCKLSVEGQPYKLFTTQPDSIFKSLNQKDEITFANDSGKVVYNGLIRNYNPGIGTFVSIQYRNKTGQNFSKVADIEKNGSFRFDLEITEPQEISVNLLFSRENIFLLPGENLFHLANSGDKDYPSLFMGESANVTLRYSTIRKLRNNIDYSNRIGELSDDEFLDLILNANKSQIDQFKESKLREIKVSDNMFLIPSRSIEITFDNRKGISQMNSFWISNEISNKEYRKFTTEILSNPNRILRWENGEWNSISRAYEIKTNVEIYSEVAKNLIDSSLEVQVWYNSKILKLNVIDYLNNSDFDLYPVVGVPLKGAEFYCNWWSNKNNIEGIETYKLPNEMIIRIVTDYLKEINNYNESAIEKALCLIPRDTIAFLNSNAPEWFYLSPPPPGAVTSSTTREKEAVLLGWTYSGDILQLEYNNDKNLKYAGFRMVKFEDNSKKQVNKSQLIMIIWALGILIAGALVVFAIWKWRVRQRFRREQQQRRLRELELTAIRSQMNPHFLFNSLNSVQNLVQQNKGREAHLYLADFAGLIRKVLQNSEKEEVSLAEELEMTEQYLNLEKLRFDFDFTISVEQGIDINNTMVPSMLLQPFAENAVIHGLQNKPENRRLKIEVLKKGGGEGRGKEKGKGEGRGKGGGEDKGIVISIEDNGIGREAAAAISKTKNGKGSKLIQERLEILQEKQGEKYRLEITDLTGDETGTRVEIFIPEEN